MNKPVRNSPSSQNSGKSGSSAQKIIRCQQSTWNLPICIQGHKSTETALLKVHLDIVSLIPTRVQYSWCWNSQQTLTWSTILCLKYFYGICGDTLLWIKILPQQQISNTCTCSCSYLTCVIWLSANILSFTRTCLSS